MPKKSGPVLIAAFLLALQPVSGRAAAQDCPWTHTVARGESLSVIAGRYYGNVRGYGPIRDANRRVLGRDSRRVEIGTVLLVPCPDGVAPRVADPVPEWPAALQPDPGPAPEWNVLVGVEDLLHLRPGSAVQLVDIRADAAAAAGLIPGSISMPFEAWRVAAEPEPSADDLSRLIGAAGLDLGRPIVIVHDRLDAVSVDRAAFVYWVLKVAGAARIAILEPGFEGWRSAGMRITRLERRVLSTRVALTLDESWLTRGDEIDRIAAGIAPGALLSGRPDRIVGAGAALVPDRAARRAGDILEMLKDEPVAWEQMPVISVASGELSGAALWFYASEVAGIRNVRFYPADRS